MGYGEYFWPFELDKFPFSMHNAPMSHAQDAHNPGVCSVRAYAKVNLTLDVLGRRADGYHELTTVMQTVDLCDTICLTERMEKGVHIRCNWPELNNAKNLAVCAAQLVLRRLRIERGVLLELHKGIPMAAGLGGGSSDAAAVLLALRTWWRLPLSPGDLQEMAASLGSDVPFFLTGGLALCEGRGERVTPLAPRWPASWRWLVLVKPSIALATADVFARLPTSDFGDGARCRAVCSALEAAREPALLDVHNALERCVLEHYPEVARARSDLLAAGVSLVRLSGSGPTLFAPCSELMQAVQIQQEMQAQGYQVYLSRAIYPPPGEICQF
jgi:4-diphosphocytidyl-2-C-methyl-D-erythritol kinase